MNVKSNLILLMIVPALAAGAVVSGDFSSSVGAGDNLLADSTAIADQWVRVGGGLRAQLHPNFGLRWSGRWSHFLEHDELDGNSQELGIDFQKGKMTDRLLHYVGLSGSRSEYPDETYRLSSRILALESLIQYYVKPETSLRAGLEASSRNFPSFDLADQQRMAVFAGVNHSFPGGSAVDLEAGYDRIAFINLSEDQDQWGHGNSGHSSSSGGSDIALHLLSLQARYSRSLGANTGLALSAWTYSVVSGEDEVLALPDQETLPQEVLFFGEQAVNLSLKRFLPWRLLGRIQMQAWNRRYLDAAPVGDADTNYADRTDVGKLFGAEIWKRFHWASAIEFEPRLSLTWQGVESTDDYFDQESWSASLSLGFGF